MTTIRDNMKVKAWTQEDLKKGDIFTWGRSVDYFLYVDALNVIQLNKPERTNTIGDLVDFHEPLSIVKTLEVTEWK